MPNRFASLAACVALGSSHLGAQTVSVGCDQPLGNGQPSARVTLDLGNGSSAIFDIRTFVLDVRAMAASVADTMARSAPRNAELHVIKRAGPYTQLTADYQDAQRELTTSEQLGKSRVTPPLEVSRARDRAAELARRLDLAKQRHALLLRDLEAQGYLDEELTLRFSGIDIMSR